MQAAVCYSGNQRRVLDALGLSPMRARSPAGVRGPGQSTSDVVEITLTGGPVDGALLAEVAVPAANVTACAFGGPALRTLYITTHGGDKPDKTGEPHAGGLFVVETGVQGTLAHRFADQ